MIYLWEDQYMKMGGGEDGGWQHMHNAHACVDTNTIQYKRVISYKPHPQNAIQRVHDIVTIKYIF